MSYENAVIRIWNVVLNITKETSSNVCLSKYTDSAVKTAIDQSEPCIVFGGANLYILDMMSRRVAASALKKAVLQAVYYTYMYDERCSSTCNAN